MGGETLIISSGNGRFAEVAARRKTVTSSPHPLSIVFLIECVDK